MLHMTDGGFGRVTDQIVDAVDVSVGAAKHAAVQVGSAAEDLRYKTSRTIKRHPAKVVLATAAVAFFAGLLVGRLAHRY